MSHKIKTSVDVDGYLSADHLKISTSSIENVDVGEIVWNAIDGTFDMGLIGGVTLQSGQEMHMYGKATEVISNGQAVMFAGVQGDHILIAKADAATINSNPEYFIGIATQNFAINQFGYVTVFGNVRGLDTTSYALGSVLYYDSTTSTDGLLTSTEPSAPNAKIEVAAVVRVHATQGILLVRPHVMPKLNDIQDIFAPNPFNNDVLFWNGFSSRYETNTIPGILGYNPVPPSRTITINGNTQDLSTNISYTIPTHDPVTISTQANGLSITGQVLSLGLSSASANGALSSIDWTTFNSKQNALSGNGFVRLSGSTVSYITGNQDQYIKADGSLSTAMNSRIEVNFVATAGQTTFTTPYEVGQIDVYYNGSKLYPNEFTATNGTTVVLAQAATLNAQISIVKYVAALSTSAIRNETTFTTTAGQTTFSVNYTVGQVDVFYNGSKLNVSEFTAINGTSVVLGFSCAAGESVVFVSYVNQVSGASGTTNYVSKFTGAASLGDSQIFDNGSNVVIGGSSGIAKLTVVGTMFGGSMFFNNGNISTSGSTFISLSTNSSERLRVNTNGNVLIGTTTDAGFRLDVNGTGRIQTNLMIGSNSSATSKLEVLDGDIKLSSSYKLGWRYTSADSNMYNYISSTANGPIQYDSGSWTGGNVLAHDFRTWTGSTWETRMSIRNISGNVGIGTQNPVYTLDVNGIIRSTGLGGFAIGNTGGIPRIQLNNGNTFTFLAPADALAPILAASFNTSSDYRLKQDLQPINGLDLVSQINVYDYQWKSDKTRAYGVLAHELQKVIPQAVNGDKDAEEMQGVDYSKLVPILVQAIQELKAEIEILKNK